MPDQGADKGMEPAPWETPGKRHTQMRPGQPPAQPQRPQAYPPRPAQPTPAAYPARPAQPRPGGYMGQPPAQPGPNAIPPAQPRAPQPPATPAYPQGAPPQYPAGAPQYPPGAPQPYPPGAPQYPPGGPQPYPAGAYGQQPGMPYGQQMPMYGQQKPNSTKAIVSLVLIAGIVVGAFGIPLFIAGLVFGILALRETGPSGPKAGRGMAMAGTIVHSILLALMLAVGAFVVFAVTKADSMAEEAGKTQSDSNLIIQRVRQYEAAKGNLEPGGPQMIGGYRNETAVVGSLKVSDLVSATELEHDRDRYRLDVNARARSAKLFYTDDDGKQRQVGSYPYNVFGGGDFDFD